MNSTTPGKTRPKVDYFQFARAIARTVCPTLELNDGLDCLRYKMIYTDRPIPLRPIVHIQEYSPSDIALLQELLAKLPKVHSDMSFEERETFYLAYSALKNRPEWYPAYTALDDKYINRMQQWDVMELHRHRLEKLLKDGKLRAFNANSIPAEALQARIFIDAADAQKYIESCGITLNPEYFPELELIKQKSAPQDFTNGSQAVKEFPATPKKKTRKDAIAHEIDKIKPQSAEPADVRAAWNLLNDIARTKKSPFVSVHADCIKWRSLKGDLNELDYEGFRSRVKYYVSNLATAKLP